MRRKRSIRGAVCTAMLAVALTSLGFVGSASATLTGEYTKFAYCPRTNPEVNKCIQSVTTGGEVVLGSKAVPIVNPVTVQGGVGYPGVPVPEFEEFFAATNGVTLSKAPQPVPGGLAGLVNCKKISNLILRATCELAFENAVTGVNSTLELARPANEIQISELHLGEEEEVALKLPIKIRLENPLLGESCYVGSSESPIYWNLTTGFTHPPAPAESIRGSVGTVSFLDGGKILKLADAKLVDNAWAAPAVNGCGGALSAVLDPIISVAAGLPAAEGKNSAILINQVALATAFGVEENNLENP